jgi:hypothetical protein
MKNKSLDYLIELMSYSTTQPSTQKPDETRHIVSTKKCRANHASSY